MLSGHLLLSVFKALALPPLSLLLIAMVGLGLRRKRARLGTMLTAISLAGLYICSTPLFGGWSLGLLEDEYVDPKLRTDAQAIVVIGGGTVGFAPEYGADTLNHLSLIRVRYAARLQRATGKPLIVAGGSVSLDTTPEATQMAAMLTEELGVPVRWTESRSRDTFGNAVETGRILGPLGIKTVYLVTHAWHMPRARLAFEHAGFQVLPAPTGFARGSDDPPIVLDFLPRASALLNSYYFFHEVFGYLAYQLRVRL